VHRLIVAAVLGATVAASAVRSADPAPAPPTGADVASCLDGTCTVAVSGPVDIPLDGRAGVTDLTVTEVTRYAVTFRTRTATGGGLASTSPGGVVRYTSSSGTLTVRVLSLSDGPALLDLATTTAAG
jgi:hypothetical protein